MNLTPKLRPDIEKELERIYKKLDPLGFWYGSVHVAIGSLRKYLEELSAETRWRPRSSPPLSPRKPALWYNKHAQKATILSLKPGEKWADLPACYTHWLPIPSAPDTSGHGALERWMKSAYDEQKTSLWKEIEKSQP